MSLVSEPRHVTEEKLIHVLMSSPAGMWSREVYPRIEAEDPRTSAADLTARSKNGERAYRQQVRSVCDHLEGIGAIERDQPGYWRLSAAYLATRRAAKK